MAAPRTRGAVTPARPPSSNRSRYTAAVSLGAIALLWVARAPPSPDEPMIPSDFALQWRAPDGCPDAEEIRRRVTRYYGARASGGSAARIEGEVVGDDAGGYALALRTEFEGQAHAREMHAPTCDALAEGTAIVIVVALRHGLSRAMEPGDGAPPRALPPVVPTPEVAPADPAAGLAAPAEPIAPPADPTMSREFAWPSAVLSAPQPPTDRLGPRAAATGLLQVAGAVEAGALGAVTGGLQLGVAIAWPRVRAAISGVWLAARRRRDDASRLLARFEGGAVAVRGCWTPTAWRLVLPLCGGFEAGVVRIDADFARPSTLYTPWAGPLLGFSVAWREGSMRPWIGVEAVARAVGTRFRVQRRDGFAQWPASVRAVIGVEVAFGREKSTTRAKNPGAPDIAGVRRAP